MPERDPREREFELEKVRACQAGEREAFDCLVEKYREMVYAVAYRFARDQDLALDLSQDIFVRAYRGIRSFKGRSAFGTWLYRIAVNTCIDYTRRRARSVESKAVPEEVAEYAESEPLEARGARGPREDVLAAELGEQIENAIDALPDYHKSVFVLYEIEGLPYREIARVVGCSVGTVMSRLHYARKKLRKMLAPYVEFGDAARTDGKGDE